MVRCHLIDVQCESRESIIVIDSYIFVGGTKLKNNKSRIAGYLKKLVLAFGITLVCIFGLSSAYYKSLVLNPVMVWHGASANARMIFNRMFGIENNSCLLYTSPSPRDA